MAGDRIDIDADAARVWLSKRGIEPTETGPWKGVQAPKPPAGDDLADEPEPDWAEGDAADPVAPPPGPPTDEPADAEALLDLTFRVIAERHGSVEGFQDWLDARKRVGEIKRIEIQNATTSGRVVSRELVRAHLFGALDAANRRLLTDTPKTIARRLYALAKSGADLQEAEAAVRDLISSQLKPMKANAARVLRNA